MLKKALADANKTARTEGQRAFTFERDAAQFRSERDRLVSSLSQQSNEVSTWEASAQENKKAANAASEKIKNLEHGNEELRKQVTSLTAEAQRASELESDLASVRQAAMQNAS